MPSWIGKTTPRSARVSRPRRSARPQVSSLRQPDQADVTGAHRRRTPQRHSSLHNTLRRTETYGQALGRGQETRAQQTPPQLDECLIDGRLAVPASPTERHPFGSVRCGSHDPAGKPDRRSPALIVGSGSQGIPALASHSEGGRPPVKHSGRGLATHAQQELRSLGAGSGDPRPTSGHALGVASWDTR